MRSDNPLPLNARATDDLAPRLRRHVDVLAELIGQRNTQHPEGLRAARRYIIRELQEMKHSVEEQRFAVTGREAINYEVLLRGTHPHRPALVIGAHYDTVVGTPGADDNASSVAILLEIMRSMAGRQRRRTLRAVFYDTEEMPHFATGEMGSQYHAAGCRRLGERLLGMICLESLGYFVQEPEPLDVAPRWMQGASRAIGRRSAVLVGNAASAAFLMRIWPRMVRRGGVSIVPIIAPRLIRPIEFSDHRSYWEQGYPAVMLTDTAFLRNPHYHRASDRLATLNLEAMAKLCRQVTRAVECLVEASSQQT
jgi:hypothetical protein